MLRKTNCCSKKEKKPVERKPLLDKTKRFSTAEKSTFYLFSFFDRYFSASSHKSVSSYTTGILLVWLLVTADWMGTYRKSVDLPLVLIIWVNPWIYYIPPEPWIDLRVFPDDSQKNCWKKSDGCHYPDGPMRGNTDTSEARVKARLSTNLLEMVISCLFQEVALVLRQQHCLLKTVSVGFWSFRANPRKKTNGSNWEHFQATFCSGVICKSLNNILATLLVRVSQWSKSPSLLKKFWKFGLFGCHMALKSGQCDY